MTFRKIAAATAVVPLILGVSAASAATAKKPVKKPVCNLMKDAKADATDTGTGVAAPNDPNLDIVSADLATNATTVTAVIRLAAVDGSGSNSPAGRGYDVTFTAKNGTALVIRGVVSPAGNSWADGKGTGTVDAAKKEVRISVPISALSAPIKANDKLTDVRASSWRWVGTTPVTLGRADRADAAAPYVASWPSCVKVGV